MISGPSFDNSYARLPAPFFTRLDPTPVPEPRMIRWNAGLATRLGIDPRWLGSEAGLRALSGNEVPPGAEPIAAVYAGHQFGVWNPQLGDGRAHLLGEVVGTDGVRYDLQLKGSGRTPYSRAGDGKAPLGPVLREYVVSEAMAALGIPTTRSLAAVATGETVYRETGPLPGAVLTRVAQSHIRIGTFEFFAARGDVDAVRALFDHVLERHFPGARGEESPARAVLDEVIRRQADLVARWMGIGFIHGVMNTDNMLLSGETIDYGPCAFMDHFDPGRVLSSIDHGGRYAYGNQPRIAHWNLARLAQSLLPLLDDDRDRAIASAQAAVDAFPALFLDAHRRVMTTKLGLTWRDEGDDELVRGFLDRLAAESADFTLAFRRLAELADPDAPAVVGSIFDLPESFAPWLERWRERLAEEPGTPAARRARIEAVNPFLVPRNHLVEAAIVAATGDDDFKPFHDLVDTLAHPFEARPEAEPWAKPPLPEEVVARTFCGT